MKLKTLPEGYLDKELEKQLPPEEIHRLEVMRHEMTQRLSRYLEIFKTRGAAGLKEQLDMESHREPFIQTNSEMN